jgi:hypothetical protein
MAPRSATWWSGRHAWCSWLGMREPMRGVPARDLSRNFSLCPPPCEKRSPMIGARRMPHHERLAQRPAIRVFFADPHSPWQRGTNENINGLLRQYLPKGTDVSWYTQRKLNAVA